MISCMRVRIRIDIRGSESTSNVYIRVNVMIIDMMHYLNPYLILSYLKLIL